VLWWLALAATLLLPPWGEANQAVVPECEGMKIGILDLNNLSEAANVPKCTLNDVRPSSFVSRLPEHTGNNNTQIPSSPISKEARLLQHLCRRLTLS